MGAKLTVRRSGGRYVKKNGIARLLACSLEHLDGTNLDFFRRADHAGEVPRGGVMPKNICIFSDGTGQMGGLRPDQRLSNIYKMYRAMRPGPDSAIDPKEQVAFYDAGLGTGERSGFFGRVKLILESAVGTGIDHNIADCYEKIIAHYEPGDRVLLFGFSRGAYTVRALANVMNLCGIPTRMPDGSAVPRYGPGLRKIADDAVKFVYSHGAGRSRGQEPFYTNREELGRRFREKYGSAPVEGNKPQGNVQPFFIGVFDTVASLQTVKVQALVFGGVTAAVAAFLTGLYFGWSAWVLTPLGILILALMYQLAKSLRDAFKYFSPDPQKRLRLGNPLDWPQILKTGHLAYWRKRNYDRFLDEDVGHARHAMAIDEDRAAFPRVGWGSKKAATNNKDRKPEWLRQVWFAGCHSDIGGSYPEDESRLSDIALNWMIEELRECVPTIQINEEVLHRFPDAQGLQHREDEFFKFGWLVIPWRKKPRMVEAIFPLHPSVLERLGAGPVPQVGEIKPYRPSQLEGHQLTKKYFDPDRVNPGHESSG